MNKVRKAWKKKDIYSKDVANGWIPWGVISPILTMIFIIGAIVIGTNPLVYLGLLNTNAEPTSSMGAIAFLFIPFSLMWLFVFLWIKSVEKRSLETVGIYKAKFSKSFGRGYLLGLVMVVALVVFIWLLGGYKPKAMLPAFSSPEQLLIILALLLGFLIQSCAEEFVFRGWLLSSLTRKFNLLVGVIVSSLLFTLLHYSPDNIWQDTLNSFLFAVFACALAIRANNIWGAMAWHSSWNWLVGVGFGLPITGFETGTSALLIELQPVGERWLTGGVKGPESSMVCNLMFFIGGIYLFLNPKKSKTNL